ncbi:MAG: ABC transporter substrate-binding protein, partial [Alphaproteobacteria bacterium]|nr:ABC transporter substrate-binding protein [Alphaproteobacteria bacterium]
LPYISRFTEDHIKENEVRLLKAVNGEFDYKSQSVQLPAAPMLLENRKRGSYEVDLKPTIAMPVLGFNITSADPEKRKLFSDLRFRQAMSVAINRAEINDVAFFGLGEPRQYTAFSPAPSFVGKDMQSHMAQFDPAMAKRLLDEIGMRDRDGDGARELPNGAKFTLNIQFATQGMPGQVAELVAQQWSAVGVRTTVKEITPDELRSAQTANQLDIVPWLKGQPLAIVLGNAELFMPPYENYFGGRIGMLWAEYVESKGAKGEKPPAYAEQMMADITAFQSAQPGTKESDALGARLVKSMTENLLWIGTVQAPAPIYHSNRLKNFTSFKTWSSDYYRTYPYRPQQWFLADGK